MGSCLAKHAAEDNKKQVVDIFPPNFSESQICDYYVDQLPSRLQGDGIHLLRAGPGPIVQGWTHELLNESGVHSFQDRELLLKVRDRMTAAIERHRQRRRQMQDSRTGSLDGRPSASRGTGVRSRSFEGERPPCQAPTNSMAPGPGAGGPSTTDPSATSSAYGGSSPSATGLVSSADAKAAALAAEREAAAAAAAAAAEAAAAHTAPLLDSHGKPFHLTSDWLAAGVPLYRISEERGLRYGMSGLDGSVRVGASAGTAAAGPEGVRLEGVEGIGGGGGGGGGAELDVCHRDGGAGGDADGSLRGGAAGAGAHRSLQSKSRLVSTAEGANEGCDDTAPNVDIDMQAGQEVADTDTPASGEHSCGGGGSGGSGDGVSELPDAAAAEAGQLKGSADVNPTSTSTPIDAVTAEPRADEGAVVSVPSDSPLAPPSAAAAAPATAAVGEAADAGIINAGAPASANADAAATPTLNAVPASLVAAATAAIAAGEGARGSRSRTRLGASNSGSSSSQGDDDSGSCTSQSLGGDSAGGLNSLGPVNSWAPSGSLQATSVASSVTLQPAASGGPEPGQPAKKQQQQLKEQQQPGYGQQQQHALQQPQQGPGVEEAEEGITRAPQTQLQACGVEEPQQVGPKGPVTTTTAAAAAAAEPAALQQEA